MADLFPSSEVLYWVPTENTRNFGDYVSELFLDRVLSAPRIRASKYRLIGSIIDNDNIWNDLQSITDDGAIAYWGCGARDAGRIREDFRKRLEFCGVRGPLTRDLLGLPADTVLGDPALILPLVRPPAAAKQRHGKTLCIPHIYEPKTDAELKAISGVEMVVRPAVAPTLEALEAIIDQITGADFVLAGAMHAAIIAHAYGIPFAFFDTGHLDIPFKWRDFAASIDIPVIFVKTLADGRAAYEDLIRPKAKRLPLLPILSVAPYYVNPSVAAKAAAHDAGLALDARLVATLQAAPIEDKTYGQAAVRSERARDERLRARFDALGEAAEQSTLEARETLAAKAAALAEVEQLRAKSERDIGRMMADAEHYRLEMRRASQASSALSAELELSRRTAAQTEERLRELGTQAQATEAQLARAKSENAELGQRLEAERAEKTRQIKDERLAAEGLRRKLEGTEARVRELQLDVRMQETASPRARDRGGWQPAAWSPDLMLARFWARCSAWPAAERHYAKLLLKDPHQPRLLVQYGHALKEQGELEQAATAYARASAQLGGDFDTAQHLAFTLRETGRHDAAATVEQAAVRGADYDEDPQGAGRPSRLPPSPVSLFTRLAAIRAAKTGDWPRAAWKYRSLVRQAPRHTPFWIQYGHALKEGGETSQALSAYLAALRLDPTRADTHLQIGHALKLLKRGEDARRAFGRAFQLEPSNVSARRELEMAGMPGEALVPLLLQAKPKGAGKGGGGLVDLLAAKMAAKKKRWGAAVKGYRRRLKLSPGDWRSWVQLGHALKEQGSLIEAEGAYLQALALKPDAADIHLQLGHALKIRGRFHLAAEAYQRALALDSGLEDARRELDAVEGEIARSVVVAPTPAGRPRRGLDMREAAGVRHRLGLSRREAKLWGDLAAAVKAKSEAEA